ncbi:uncharacterized protein LOC133911253 isoform X2 [Phragmites australis]|uniref:uncharacterized protein LOC133911253 isoform X2 n=1 Tax=Phragmites australis TaxID=29695 RepID=UPI002D77197D|nr:uncharacterized protein LOC133911253 isoform X2 [Phragmites australis]
MQAAGAVRHPHLLAPSPGRARHHRRAPATVRMALREDGPSVAIVGVTGAVGQEFLRVISDRDFPYRSLRLLASERSAGKSLSFEDHEYTVQDLAAPGAFDGVDIALFSAGGGVSRKYAPAAVASGAVVVDNSSAFRMDPEVPLVIPEVNPEAMANVRLGQGAIVANPNCSTIICLMAATPLHRHAKVVRMVVSTYQAASGAGAAAMEELKLQTQEVLEGKVPTCNIFKQQNDKDVKVTATCVRVPVMRAHAESVNLQFEKPLDEDTAREILRAAPGVTIVDDRAANRFPTPLEVSDKDDVAVGRIRQDLSQDDNQGLDIFVCGDQIRKGAALNAVQIAEMLLK